MIDPDVGPTDPALVTIRRYPNAWQAETTRIRLAEAGIPAFVTESETSTMLSYVGTALGGVRVRVPADDQQRALQVLADDAARLESAGHWQCSRCDEVNEPAFELCWSCSKPRSDDDPLVPPPELDSEGDRAVGFGDDAAKAFPAAPLPPEDRAPYRPVGSDSLRPVARRDGTMEAQAAEDAESRVRYAFRAAVLGFFLLPPLLNVYSFVLLLGLVAREGGMPPAVRTRFWLTWALNVLGVGWGAIVIAMVISQL